MAALYRNERFKFDDRAMEQAEFDGHVEQVRQVQAQVAAREFGGVAQRVFHMKRHATLLGTLTLRPDRPATVRHGLFGDDAPASYRVLARFSNGDGRSHRDGRPDVRGIALKIFGARDADGSTRCVDWLMTNSPNPFGRDQQEFVEFMVANAGSKADLLTFLASHPRVAALLAKATAAPVTSLASERYWSGHAYLLGADMAMKFNVAPVDAAGAGLQGLVGDLVDADQLRHELLQRLAQGPVRFTLNVQLEKTPETTPIEDTLAEWEEADSPSIPVADLVLDRASEAIDGEALRFTPAHFVAAHRPLGNMARGRMHAYRASQDGRGAAADDPSEQAVFGAA